MPDGKKVSVLQMKQYLEELEATEPKASDTRRFLPTMKNTVQLFNLLLFICFFFTFYLFFSRHFDGALRNVTQKKIFYFHLLRHLER